MNKKNLNHIDNKIVNAMHTLEIKSVHNFKLIGSNSLTSILYANDYDLNSNINISNLESVYKQFLNLFDKCYKKNCTILQILKTVVTMVSQFDGLIKIWRQDL